MSADEVVIDAPAVADADPQLAPRDDEPPVVARLVVEIRSDGSRTLARGAIEDMVTGDRVTVEADAASPLELASSLARMLLGVPRLAARALDVDASSEDPGRRGGGLRRGIRRRIRRGVGASLRRITQRKRGDDGPSEDTQ